MKLKFFILFLIVFSLICCSEKKEDYYGEWIMISPYLEKNQAEKIIITKDSIEFSEYPFSSNLTFKHSIENNKIKVLNSEFNIKIKDDSILVFNDANYIKYPNNSFDFPKRLLSINLPKIEEIKPTNIGVSYHVYFGKKLNSEKYSLQLNDKLTESKELKNFLYSYENSITTALYIDKNAIMKDVNLLLREMKTINKRRVYLVNEQKFIVKNDTSLVSSLECTYLFLTQIEEEKLFYEDEVPPPPPSISLWTLIEDYKKYKVFSIINNEYYFGLQKVPKSELVNIIKKNSTWFLMNFYDDVSNYKTFLELINAYQNAFFELRNEESIKRFNKPLDSLTKEEIIEIKRTIPMNVLNGVSYNDFKKIKMDIPELKLIK